MGRFRDRVSNVKVTFSRSHNVIGFDRIFNGEVQIEYSLSCLWIHVHVMYVFRCVAAFGWWFVVGHFLVLCYPTRGVENLMNFFRILSMVYSRKRGG